MRITCPVSVGELVDKISILLVKKGKIKDSSKLDDCEKELVALTQHLPPEINSELAALVKVNRELFEILEKQHELIRNKDFGQTFCEMAQRVYHLNRERYALKDALNIRYKSDIVERKSY